MQELPFEQEYWQTIYLYMMLSVLLPSLKVEILKFCGIEGIAFSIALPNHYVYMKQEGQNIRKVGAEWG